MIHHTRLSIRSYHLRSTKGWSIKIIRSQITLHPSRFRVLNRLLLKGRDRQLSLRNLSARRGSNTGKTVALVLLKSKM